MDFDVVQSKKCVTALNAILLVLGIIDFFMGCVYLAQFSSEAYIMIADYNMTPNQVIETDTSIAFCLMVGRILIAFGLGRIGLAILAIVGVWKHNMFVLQFVTALLAISVIILGLIGIGALLISGSAFVDDNPKVALPLNDEQKSYVVNKYDCCYDRNCLDANKDNCEDVIIRNILKFRDIISSLFLMGAIFDVITIVLTIFFIKALNELRIPRFPVRHHLIGS